MTEIPAVKMLSDIKNFFGSYPLLSILISLSNQKLYLLKGETVFRVFSVSTSSKGAGNIMNSFKTPVGFHQIEKKIGDGVPLYGRIKSRLFTGEIIDPSGKEIKEPKEDIITTRILWLKGLEEGINKGGQRDTFNRFIYIHGTNEEYAIGTPCSHGCVRMKNDDILELYEEVEEGTPVLISESLN